MLFALGAVSLMSKTRKQPHLAQREQDCILAAERLADRHAAEDTWVKPLVRGFDQHDIRRAEAVEHVSRAVVKLNGPVIAW